MRGKTKNSILPDLWGDCRSIEGLRLTIICKLDDKTASFAMLETAQILTNRTEEAEVIVTLA
jgi:hypothetical protein